MSKGKKKNQGYSLYESEARTPQDLAYQDQMEKYFHKSLGTTWDKLVHFTKYIPRQRLTNFLAKYEIFKRVIHIHGHIVECGVFLGSGLMTWAQLSAIFEPVYHMGQIIGFDTFKGFPSVHSTDKGRVKSDYNKTGGCAVDSYEDLQECIRLFDMNRFINHIPKVQLVKGDVKKTIPQYVKENKELVIRLLYLDMDIYQPTKVALKHFIPRMPKGAIIAFDELANPRWPGETQAVFEEVGINKLRIEKVPFHSAISFAVIE